MKLPILTLFTISSLVVLAGCQSATNVSNTNLGNTGITETLNQNEVTEVIINTTDNVNTSKVENENVISNENANINSVVVIDEVDSFSEALSQIDEVHEDTSNWKTYENETLALLFKYPKDWRLEPTQDGEDFTEILDNNDIYDHELVNLYVHWSDRHEDIVYNSGITNPTLDKWLNCDYVYDLQSECSSVLMNGIEVIRREGQIEPPFGDDYIALAYKKNDFTIVIDARSLLRESSNNAGNTNLDGLQYINTIIETMSIN